MRAKGIETREGKELSGFGAFSSLKDFRNVLVYFLSAYISHPSILVYSSHIHMSCIIIINYLYKGRGVEFEAGRIDPLTCLPRRKLRQIVIPLT